MPMDVLIVQIVPLFALCLIVVSDLVVVCLPWILRLADGKQRFHVGRVLRRTVRAQSAGKRDSDSHTVSFRSPLSGAFGPGLGKVI